MFVDPPMKISHTTIVPVLILLLLIQAMPVVAQPVSGRTGSGDIPVLLWSDKIGERESLVACSGDGRVILAGSDTGILRMYAVNFENVEWLVADYYLSDWRWIISHNSYYLNNYVSSPYNDGYATTLTYF